MLNAKIISQPIGPNGEFGTVDVSLVEGKLVAGVTLSPKACVDAAAKDIAKVAGGSAIPGQIAGFLEAAVGLA